MSNTDTLLLIIAYQLQRIQRKSCPYCSYNQAHEEHCPLGKAELKIGKKLIALTEAFGIEW